MSGDEKPPTIRQQINGIVAVVENLAQKIDAPRQETVLRPVVEAATLADCIRAMDALVEAERNNRTSVYGTPTTLGSVSAERVLRHLADKYGVQLVKVETQPCNRAHLDDLDATALSFAIRSAVQS